MSFLDKVLKTKDKSSSIKTTGDKGKKDESVKKDSVVKDAKIVKSEELKAKSEVEKKDDVKKTAKAETAAKVKVDKENTKDAYKVLVKPIISEKATEIGKLNQYVFEVSPKANRVEIKKAIMAVYGIIPVKVNIINMRGKKVRFGRTYGKRKDWKKAIITLPKGQSIQLYEGT